MIRILVLTLCLVSSTSFAQEKSKIKKIVNWEGSKIEISSNKPINIDQVDYIELRDSAVINNEEISARINEIENVRIRNNRLHSLRLDISGNGGTSGGGG